MNKNIDVEPENIVNYNHVIYLCHLNIHQGKDISLMYTMGDVKLDGGTKTTIFDYNTDFAIFISTISQICQFLIFFPTITLTLPFSLICGIGFSRICLSPLLSDVWQP